MFAQSACQCEDFSKKKKTIEKKKGAIKSVMIEKTFFLLRASFEDCLCS